MLTKTKCGLFSFALAIAACGKTPDSLPGARSGGREASTATSGESGKPGGLGTDASPFSCPEATEPGRMAAVPASAFVMGCDPGVESDCRDDEMPVHSVSLDAFEIDVTEVTQEEYSACVGAKACDPPLCTWNCSTAGMPAGCIDWSRAKAYCAWAQKRLPTEAEWEKAARGTDGRKFPWGDDAADCTNVNMSGCGERAATVGSHPAGASPYGALDMAGNVVEMVSDWYDAAFYTTSPAQNPKGPASGSRYVGRGGGFRSEVVWERTAARDWYDLTDQGASLGFRCAR